MLVATYRLHLCPRDKQINMQFMQIQHISTQILQGSTLPEAHLLMHLP